MRAQGVDLQTAEELLIEKIWTLLDLDEPIAFRYETQPLQNTAIIQISANEVSDASDPERYFEGGFCSTCQSGQGRRNDRVLQVLHIPRGTVSGLNVRFQPYFKCGMRIGMILLHGNICKELQNRGKPLLEFREVQVKGRRTSGFFEVTPVTLFPYVVPLSRKGKVGGQCSKCGAQFIYPEAGKTYLRKSDADVIRKHGAGAADFRKL